MKKIISFMVVLFGVLVLSGCGLLPQDTVDTLSEDLCRENPENQLCNITSLDSVEESVVLELVNGVLANIDSANIADYCNQYISVTNPDLLDACELQTATFVPQNVGSVTAVEVTKNGDVYTVKVTTDTPYQYFMLEVKVGEVEGETKILSWVAGTLSVDTVEKTEDNQMALIEEFFLALGDSSNSDSALCTDYYDGIDNDCDGVVEFDRSGTYVVVNIVLIEENLYQVTYTVNGSEEMTTTLRLDSDDDGDSIIVEITHKDEVTVDPTITFEEVEALATQMVSDYNNEMITSLAFGQLYFNQDLGPEFNAERAKRIMDGVTLSLLEVNKMEDGTFVISFEVVYPNETLIEEINVKPIRLESRLAFAMVDGDTDPYGDYVTGVEAEQFILDFVLDYQNSAINNEYLNQTYFMGMMDEDFLMGRLESLDVGITITVLDITLLDNGWYELNLAMIMDGFEDSTTTKIRVHRIDMAMMLELDDGEDNDCDGTDYCENPYGDPVIGEEAELFIQNFIDDYMDATVSSTYINETYFMGMLDEMFLAERDESLTLGMTMTLVDLYLGENGWYDVTLEIGFDGMTETVQTHIRVNRIDMALMIEIYDGEDNDCDGYCVNPDEADAYIRMFFADYQNPDITIEMLNDKYFNGYYDEYMNETRMMLLEEMISLEIANIYSYGYEYFDVEVYVNGTDEIWYYTVYMYYNEDGSIEFGFYKEYYYEEVTLDLITTIFEAFIMDYQDATMTTEELINLYFGGYSPLGVLFDRTLDFENGTTYEVVSVTENDIYAPFKAVVRKTTDGVTEEFMVYVYVYVQDSQYILDIIDPMYNYVSENLYNFMYMVQDETYSTDEVCMTFSTDSYDLCTAITNFHRDNMYFLILYEINMMANGQITILFGTVESDYTFVEQNSFLIVYSGLDTPLHIESTTETTNPLYE